MLPSSEQRRSRTRDAKRFIQAASLGKVDRYLRWISVFDAGPKEDLYTDGFREQMANRASSSLLAPWFARANGAGIVDAALLTDTMTYLPNDLLVKVDIATMAESLEARSPFLDHHVIEFAASLPEKLKLRGTDDQVFAQARAEKTVAGGKPRSPQDGILAFRLATGSVASCSRSCARRSFRKGAQSRAVQA